MEKILNIYKPLGLTPLQLISALRNSHEEYKSIKIGFAGRLDPMAHGVMLLMLDDETKNRDKYLRLPKTYDFQVLLGASTDTYDSLGILNTSLSKKNPKDLEIQIKKFIKSKIGKHSQQYPPFSSKEVNGKPLFQWARENKLSEIEIPVHEIEIYKFELLNIISIPANEIKNVIIENIKKVNGDFRQAEIINNWNKFFRKNNNESFIVLAFTIDCSSGTYVRALANEIGKKLGTGAIALSIFRTKVGKYKIEDSLRI